MPVKGGPTAKSRLAGPVELARAIAADCLAAVLATSAVTRVLVVTNDSPTQTWAREAGADVVAESRPGAGLLAAIHDGLRHAATGTGPVAVLLADLPALRPPDLNHALDAATASLAAHPTTATVVVPDADTRGTVLLAARRAQDLDPAFGPDSLAEHQRRGALRLDLDLPRLRQDVDTASDLTAALALGCGPRTSAAASLRR